MNYIPFSLIVRVSFSLIFFKVIFMGNKANNLSRRIVLHESELGEEES